MLNIQKKQILIIIFTIASLQLLITISPGQPTPYNVRGTVKNYNGELVGEGIIVTIINERTAENKTVLTNSVSQYIVDLSNLTSGYNNGDSIKIIATMGEQTGIAYTSVDLGSPGSHADVILSQTEYMPYRLWGYVYFENYTLVEGIVNIEIINLRTGNSINTTTSIFGKYQADVSGIPDGYNDLDIYKVSATYSDWQGKVNGTLNLGNTLKETKIDVYMSGGDITDTNLSSTTTTSDQRASSFDIMTIVFFLAVFSAVKLKNRKD